MTNTQSRPAGYPKKGLCGECQKIIWICYSSRKEKEYACNYKEGEPCNYRDYHGCYNWKLTSESKETVKVTPKVVTREPKKQEPKKEPKEEHLISTTEPLYETAESKWNFDRTFKLIEVTVSMTRKVTNQTIVQLPQYENMDFFVSLKAELELGADIQQLIHNLFGEINQAIERRIEESRIQLSNIKELEK